jgi:hypothetical protein
LPVAFRQPLANDLYLLVYLVVVIRQPMADELCTHTIAHRKVGFALQLLQLQLEKHGVNTPKK